MSTLDGFDYSFARPSPPQMAAAGIKAVGRYLWPSSVGDKGVSVQEIQALWATGVGVWLGYEASSGNHLKGAAQGTIDGRAAQDLLNRLAPVVPSNWPVYFACDQEVRDDQVPIVIAYLNAAKAECPGASCYAQQSVVDTWERWSWQTTAWSPGVSVHAAIYQYEINQTFNGSAVDYNQILSQASAGILWPPGHTPQGGGTPITQGDSDMSLTPEESKQLAADNAEAFFSTLIGPVGKQVSVGSALADMRINIQGAYQQDQNQTSFLSKILGKLGLK